ncbi:MAG: LysR substrate-binding domain-containing protein, partial [Rhodoferax sp.]|nr:LysR substrate-binding domain-containing protein [Rhodoferax sp.]
PKLLEGIHPLHQPADMLHQVLLHDDTVSEWAGPRWDAWFRLAGLAPPDAQAGPHFSDSGMVYVAALDGLGVALASKPLVANALAQGRLVAPFDIAVGQQYAYYLVTPKATAQRPVVVAFRQWLMREAQAEGRSLAA